MAYVPYLPNGRPNTPRSDPKDPHQLASPLRERVIAMIEDCPYSGELGLVSGLRDPGRQWDLRRERVGLANIWKSPPTGNPVTAVPARWDGTNWVGGSKHQIGLAADFGGTQRAMDWMRANRERYGLALTVRSENWHVEPDRKDVRTGRVHNNPTAMAGRVPAAPAVPKPSAPTTTDPEEIPVAIADDLTRRLDTLEARLPVLTQWVIDQQASDKAKFNLIVAWCGQKFGATDEDIAELRAQLEAFAVVAKE